MKKTKTLLASTLLFIAALAVVAGPAFNGLGPVIVYSQTRTGNDLVVSGLRVFSSQPVLPPGTIVTPKPGFTIPNRGLGIAWQRIAGGSIRLTVGDVVAGPGSPNPYNPLTSIWIGGRIPGSEFIVNGANLTTSTRFQIIPPPGS